MDNVTHALAGLLLAEAVLGTLEARGERVSPSFRRRAWFVSALTNNLPDFDFLYTGITEGKLGYLLHHRGHTHTVGAALVFGAVTFLVVDALARRRRRRVERTDEEPRVPVERGVMLALSFAGGLVHIGMDFCNNYGVHPFWPVVDAWFYGDSIFIIEPWFVVFTVPPLYFASRKLWAKALLGAILAVFVGLAWLLPLAGIVTASVLSGGAVVWFWWCSRVRTGQRAVQSLVGSLAVLFVFAAAGRIARARVLESQADIAKLDAVLTPAPSNPLCWSAIIAGERGARYELRVLTLSLAPDLVPPEACRFEPSGRSLPESTERFGDATRDPSAPAGRTPPGLRQELAWNAPLAELRSLYASNCQAAAFLRYSRVPFWFAKSRTELYLGDLRYDREPDEEFAELEVEAKPSRCPRFVPPWRPPRHDILESR
ncbi:MAG TPA: metal-dependent hydrolase [Polyangiaceae bacterium]